MKKKMLSMVLAFAMTASIFAGCGSTADSTDAAADTDAAETTEATESGDVAASGDTWKIGGIGPITGAAAIYGNAARNGAQIAIDEINEAGGINGSLIEYNFQDDEHDAEKSVNAYNTLKDWGMQILYGTVTTAPCLAVGAETAADGIFEITPSASSTDVLTDAGNVFQVCFTDPNQGIASANYISEHALASKIAVIYDSSDVYSTGIYTTFKSTAESLGLELVSETAFTADNNTDFSVQLQQAKDAGAELVFLPFYYQQAAIVLKQAKDMDYAPIFWGVDGMDGILTLENFDTSLAEGVVLLTPFAADATDEATVSFVTKYNEAYGETPNQFAADGYDAIYVIKEAIETSGVTVDMTAQDMAPALIEAMTSISVDGLTGTGMTWSAAGEVSKGPKAVKIENGVYVSMD